MHKKVKNLFFFSITICFTLAIILCTVEITSYYILIVKKTNFYLPLQLRQAHTIEIKERFSKVYSYELGWEPRHPSELGYRGEEKNIENAMICLFGDSYTEGYSDIKKSWPYLLEKKFNRPVLNFGVDGYGIDQAYLRFEKRYSGKIHTPYVCLAVMSENIARIVNRYRGFYNRKEHIEATKPMYYKGKDGNIDLLPNPLTRADEIRFLADLTFLKKIGQKDYWYHHFEKYNLNQMVRFPYSFYLVKALPYYIQRYYEKRTQNDSDYKILYADEAALSLMSHIISNFIIRAKENNTTPIILFLPNWKDFIDYKTNGETIYNDFFLKIRNQHPNTFDAMTYFMPFFDKGDNVSDFFNSYSDGHYNPTGEQVLCDGFYKDLKAVEICTEEKTNYPN